MSLKRKVFHLRDVAAASFYFQMRRFVPARRSRGSSSSRRLAAFARSVYVSVKSTVGQVFVAVGDARGVASFRCQAC